MVTTFERLAKVLKGYIKPANWIERAFASVASALVPSYTVADDGKVLGVTKVEDGYDETVVIEKQTITLNSSKRAGLEPYTHHFANVKDGDHVYVTIVHGTTITNIDCVYVYANLKIEGEGIAIGWNSDPSTRPVVTYTAGTANESYEISAVTRETKYKAVAGWEKSGGSGALILHEDENGALDKTWQEIYDAFERNAVLILYEDENFEQAIVFHVWEETDLISGDKSYKVAARSFSSSAVMNYVTDSANGYPTFTEN